jgi:hypothetical protein
VIIIRRIYVYLLALTGLAILAVAVANLGQLVIDIVLQGRLTSTERDVRDTASLYGAAALVGLPVWLLHWRWVQRAARREPAERRSDLRHLYLYVVLAGAAIVLADAANDVLGHAFDALIGIRLAEPVGDAIVRPLPFVVVAAAVWLSHLWLAEADRLAVGESAGSSTLRRWYVFGGAFVALVALLVSVQALCAALWRLLTDDAALLASGIGPPAAASLVALGVWLVQWRILAARAHQADEGTVLRSVYLFGGLALGVIGTLGGASQLLYYALARALGVPSPGGIGGDLLQAAAGPASAVLVYGVAWAYHRAALRGQALAYAEPPRQAGVRRLYSYLVALIALAVWASGLAGLLWALGDTLSGLAASNDSALRERIALFVTLVAVGLPVWLLHWQAKPRQPDETRSLARRLYVYLTVIAATLTLVGSAAAALYRLLSLALGGPFSPDLLTDLAHALALAVVAAAVAAYHWRALRSDAPHAHSVAATQASGPPVPAAVLVEIQAPDADSLTRALAALRATGVEVRQLSPDRGPRPSRLP